MKRIALILVIALLSGPTGLAESSHADDFFSGLNQAWNGLVGMASDAGRAVSDWADDSGVTDWFDNAGRTLSGWANDSGLTDWARGALRDISAWADDIGFTEWARQVSADAQALIDENRPAVEAWLAQAGEEVNRAWNTLVHAEDHTPGEVRDALETVNQALEGADTMNQVP